MQDQHWAREELGELDSRAGRRYLNPPWDIREGFLEEVACSLRNESQKANGAGAGQQIQRLAWAGRKRGGGDWAWSKSGEMIENGGECGKLEAACPI